MFTGMATTKGIVIGVINGWTMNGFVSLLVLAWAFLYYNPTFKTRTLVQSFPYTTNNECEDARFSIEEDYGSKQGYWISPRCFELLPQG